MPDKPIGPGTVLAGRFRLEDLLQESSGARFWRATDLTLARNVAVHVIGADDERAEALLAAARASATVADGHLLRVLDAAQEQGVTYVVNEWGSGMSLDRMLAEGPLSPRRAAWVVKEVADALNTAHRRGVAHGRLVPENVMVSEAGAVKLIGFVVDGVLNGAPSRGVPGFGDQASDVRNLAALLYAALVAKWPGTDASSVPPAPREHGFPLRPRQVRAGIPRPLDAICDRILGPDQPHRHAVPIETAQEVAAALADFIGDPTGTGPVDYEHTMVLGAATGSQPQASPAPVATALPESSEEPDTASFRLEPPDPRPVGTDADPAAEPAAPDPSAGDDPEEHTGAAPSPDPEPTQAGAPVFYDEGSGVGWISAADSQALREDRPRRSPPPPPPLPEPEPKPLFAPDPPGGRPRRGWYGAETEQPTSGRPASPGLHTGSLPPVWGPDADQPPDDDSQGSEPENAGRGWLRLAAVVTGCLLLVFGVVVAFDLGRGSGPAASPSRPSSSAHHSAPAPSHVIQVVGVRDFDPQGNPPEENPQMAPLAVDGDPSTAWETMTYFGTPKLGGLKDGVGLLLDLGRRQQVGSVSLTLQGQPTSLEIYSAGASSTAPSSIDGLQRVAGATDAGTHVDLRLKHPVSTQYLVVWLTSLPPYNGGYRGRVAEVVVRS